jgi:hypothetical protein
VSQLSQLKKQGVVTDVGLETAVIKGFPGSVTTVTTVTAVFIYIWGKKFFFKEANTPK